MPEQLRKLSEIMQEMSESLLRNPEGGASSEAAHIALLFANAAWNEAVGLGEAGERYRNVMETIESENPDLWSEFETTDIGAMIAGLVRYKQAHYPNDRRRIIACGIVNSKIRVEWMNAAAPGVDSKWETQLYALVRTGECDEAVRFLQTTRRMSRRKAAKRVAEIAVELGMAGIF